MGDDVKTDEMKGYARTAPQESFVRRKQKRDPLPPEGNVAYQCPNCFKITTNPSEANDSITCSQCGQEYFRDGGLMGTDYKRLSFDEDVPEGLRDVVDSDVIFTNTGARSIMRGRSPEEVNPVYGNRADGVDSILRELETEKEQRRKRSEKEDELQRQKQALKK